MTAHQQSNGIWHIAGLTASLMAGVFTLTMISGCVTNEPLAEILQPARTTDDNSRNVCDTHTANQDQEFATDGMITLAATDNLLQIIEQTNGNVVLDFYADWCGPCRSQSRILQDLKSTACRHEALIVKINVDHHPQLAEQFRVSSLPTLVLVKDGNIAQRRTGLSDRSIVSEFLTR